MLKMLEDTNVNTVKEKTQQASYKFCIGQKIAISLREHLDFSCLYPFSE